MTSEAQPERPICESQDCLLHGTVHAYASHQCRCSTCKTANRAKMAAYRARPEVAERVNAMRAAEAAALRQLKAAHLRQYRSLYRQEKLRRGLTGYGPGGT